MAVFSLTESVVTSQDIVTHPLLDTHEVMKVVSTEDNKHIFTYLHPGCVIYQWQGETKSMINKLDCSKLIPCSESLVTINIDDQFSPGKCQVSTLSVVEDLVYVGTCWGCLVVAETNSLRPVTIFRPFSAEIESLTSFVPTQDNQCLVSVGRGYRNLIKRYCINRMREEEENSVLEENKMFALLWRTDSWVME